MGRLQELIISKKSVKTEGMASVFLPGIEVHLSLAGLIDVEKERASLEKELAETQKFLSAVKGKLENADFVARAPEKVITGEREKLSTLTEKLQKIEERLKGLK
jgi:valyl-tRNA synthetase